MPIEITMPRLSDTMESGTVIKWNVSVGDEVSSGDVVADIETDKATMELTVYDDGTIASIVVDEGASVDVGTVIAVMAEEGEDVAAATTAVSKSGDASRAAGEDEGAGGGTAVAAPPTASPGRPGASSPPNGGPVETSSGRIRISPVARRLAEEHGIDERQLNGSGPAGRIIKRDVLQAIDAAVETAASRAPSAAPAESARGTELAPVAASASRGVPATPVGAMAPGAMLAAGRVPVSNMRQTIARRLVESASSIPHYQVSMTFDMDALMELRGTLNEQLAPMGVKLSVNDFLVRACALAMYEHPDFNASWDGDSIIVHGEVNIGMAISLPADRGGGLVVGVVRNADQKSLRAISHESKALAEKARTRGLSVEDMSDSTFTLSNLGMFGVEHFTAIINPPNSAILAVGAAHQKPVVRNGELTIGHEMSATLSNDHRVIDGAMAARYLQTLKGLIETPAALMV
ncbi:MAG: 2-oxo acid dehydrogenase subunit E2 [Phycisphaerales bacterium]|nr:2-oxo acid dehydrogenase subunit E2 [Phycisphaerae bacterium]NNF43544.1 2-oxo acid dehydrogenase subunit E2 [Phycisphaerales bacterium]NNM27356.1 2-oxo acid dehydrogenase subunit E2 [Phycisphaerales bacterium]